jgi:hypothetical protein
MTSNKLLVFSLVFICWCTVFADAFKILLFPVPVKSHMFPMFAIAKGLADRGHKATIVLSKEQPPEVPEVNIGQQGIINILRFKDATADSTSMSDQHVSMLLSNDMSLAEIFANTMGVYVNFIVGIIAFFSFTRAQLTFHSLTFSKINQEFLVS